MVQLLSFDTAFRPASQGIFLGKRIRTSPEALDFTGVSRLVLIIEYWHTYITNLIHASVDPKTVQYLAGHESCKITMDIYAKVKYNRPDELVKTMSSAFAGWDAAKV